MVIEEREYDELGRPRIGREYSYDLAVAQHFLADHAANLIVALDHHATNPEVLVYTETPEGTLSPGDYYIWPLYHRTAKRIQGELARMRPAGEGAWHEGYFQRTRSDWALRLSTPQSLTRIRTAAIHALFAWDLQDSRPEALTVLNTERNLTGLTRQEALETVSTPERA